MYAAKVEALRAYVVSKGHTAPARIFDAVLLRGHLEEVKADINDILYRLYQSTRHTPYNMKIHRAILIVILSYFGMFRLYPRHVLYFSNSIIRISDMNRLMIKNISIQSLCMVITSNVRKNDAYG